MSKSKPNFVYSSDPGLILGFHGCEKSVRDAVVNEQTMLLSSNKIHEWLGHGTYFWQNNYERALDFVTHPPDGRKISTPAVLGAVISLDNCLDLMDAQYIEHVRAYYNSLKKIVAKQGMTLPRNKHKKGTSNLWDKVLRELDCYVIENLHKVMKTANIRPFDSVRGVFIEGDAIYPDAGFYDKTHIQVCIRNPNCIKGFFIPRKEVDWPENIL
ncbi:hypothetical protein [Chitinophaga defluvii]|uniref:Uncharacterized protein n=1 Tax=Chitinophaga defluvii TaxID=3163343 RepID=A0ABV2TBM5_9BACT